MSNWDNIQLKSISAAYLETALLVIEIHCKKEKLKKIYPIAYITFSFFLNVSHIFVDIRTPNIIRARRPNIMGEIRKGDWQQNKINK